MAKKQAKQGNQFPTYMGIYDIYTETRQTTLWVSGSSRSV